MAGTQPTPVDDIAGNDEELEKKIKEIVRHFGYKTEYLLIIS
jgi:hypothetical protein